MDQQYKTKVLDDAGLEARWVNEKFDMALNVIRAKPKGTYKIIVNDKDGLGAGIINDDLIGATKNLYLNDLIEDLTIEPKNHRL